jgi:hypothetical protein
MMDEQGRALKVTPQRRQLFSPGGGTRRGDIVVAVVARQVVDRGPGAGQAFVRRICEGLPSP